MRAFVEGVAPRAPPLTVPKVLAIACKGHLLHPAWVRCHGLLMLLWRTAQKARVDKVCDAHPMSLIGLVRDALAPFQTKLSATGVAREDGSRSPRWCMPAS
eukprot:433850-Amphidinium_carterae.1